MGKRYWADDMSDTRGALKSYTVAIRCSKWYHVVGLLTDMRLKWLTPHVITFNAAISACERGQKPEPALQLLVDMLRQSLRPEVITFNATISACGKGKKP